MQKVCGVVTRIIEFGLFSVVRIGLFVSPVLVAEAVVIRGIPWLSADSVDSVVNRLVRSLWVRCQLLGVMLNCEMLDFVMNGHWVVYVVVDCKRSAPLHARR